MSDCQSLNLIAVITRGSVLLIAALTGTLCIYLGWRLYKEAVESATEGSFSGKFGKLKLVAVGPGVFFAIFGMWLLVRIVDRPFQLNQTQTANSPVTSQQSYKPHATDADAVPPGAVIEGKNFLKTQANENSGDTANSKKNPCLVTRSSSMAFFSGNHEITPEQTTHALDIAINTLVAQNDKSDSVDIRSAISTLKVVRENVAQN